MSSQPLPLIQITPRRAPQVAAESLGRKPPWLKVKAPGGPNYAHVRHVMQDLKLHTVCE